MTTTIKNKQTGETLTGTVVHENMVKNTFTFCIKGDEVDHHQFRHDSWEILPPPLPTGIGAVVKTATNNYVIRIHSGLWFDHAGATIRYSNVDILAAAPLTIISEGVAL